MTAILIRIQLAVTSFLASLSASAYARRVEKARGVTFVEYALLAAVAVALAIVFRSTLSSAFSGLWGRISTNLN
jgi:Flp pilus assembly pilin Flp